MINYQRVRRIKNFIYLFIFLLFLTPVVVAIVLLFKVNALDNATSAMQSELQSIKESPALSIAPATQPGGAPADNRGSSDIPVQQRSEPALTFPDQPSQDAGSEPLQPEANAQETRPLPDETAQGIQGIDVWQNDAAADINGQTAAGASTAPADTVLENPVGGTPAATGGGQPQQGGSWTGENPSGNPSTGVSSSVTLLADTLHRFIERCADMGAQPRVVAA